MSDIRIGDGAMQRRTVLKGLTALGIGSATFRRALAAQAAQAGAVTPEMIREAEWIAGLDLTDDERTASARSITSHLRSFDLLRKVDVGYDVPPAVGVFSRHAASRPRRAAATRRPIAESHTPTRPESAEELAFLPVSELAGLIRSRQVSSMELTKLYLERLKRFDPLLKCVVNLTEDLALEQAAKADQEIAAGTYRGPLHGIPWGAKDLIAYPGYPTTWGATPFKDRVIDVKATVAARLEEAGAVLVAKLSLGAGDGRPSGSADRPQPVGPARPARAGRRPARPRRSRRGWSVSRSAARRWVASSTPCQVCGASGLRPTFGRVSRHGCMTLSWSMDKLGPIARSIEDCALIFDAIHGADGLDRSAVDQPFEWPPKVDLANIKVGYIEQTRPAGRGSRRAESPPQDRLRTGADHAAR